MTATVIIPTTGNSQLAGAIESVLNQKYPTNCYVVCDGDKYSSDVKSITNQYLGDGRIKVCYLPDNVGANGFYGHRIYAGFTHLVNTEYTLYLDQDCIFRPDHVESCIDTIESNDLDWSYSLRDIFTKDFEYICHDDCESLGKWPVFSGDYNHIDTNCYCLKTEIAIRIASVWHGGWGQDRAYYSVLRNAFKNYDVTGKSTVNYRVGGNEGSVKKEFFQYGNNIMKQKYSEGFPWRKEI